MEFFSSTNLVSEETPEMLRKIDPSVVLNAHRVVAGTGHRVITWIDVRGQIIVGVRRGQGAPPEGSRVEPPE